MATMLAEEAPAVVEETKAKKKGLFSRFRKKKLNKKKVEEDKREDSSPEDDASSTEREPSEPVVQEEDNLEEAKEQPKEDVRIENDENKPLSRKSRSKKQKVVKQRPSAQESAFEGPPRYDWIDIETAAAVKVQSIARRNKAMSDLEMEGKSTAAMRNRSRRRNARRGLQSSEDAPGALACCGIGLLFGDATEEDDDARRALEKEKYLEKKRAKAEREEELRQTYHKTMAQRRNKQRNGEAAAEGLEVIDD